VKRTAVLVSSIGLFVAGAVPRTARAESSDAVRAAIVAALARFADALKRGDAAGAASIFASDATFVAPGNFIVGREAIMASYATRFQSRKYLDGSLTTVNVAVSGDMAQELGTSVFTIQLTGQAPSTVTGHYLSTWRKQRDGSWLIQADAPIADPAPAK